MTRRRTPADLYAPGLSLTLTRPEGPVRVWLQKLSHLDQRTAAQRAGAARAVVVADRRQPDSAFMADLGAEVASTETSRLIQYVISEDQARISQSVAARLELEEGSPWGKDGYLEGLYVAWEGGLKDTWQADPEDEKAAKVFAELKRWSTEVGAALDEEEASLRREWEGASREVLEAKAIERLADTEQATTYEEEYRLSKVWLCTRACACAGECSKLPADHMVRYFTTRAHVDLADPYDSHHPDGRDPSGVIAQIMAALDALEVGVTEVKDSPATPASSPLPAPPSVEEQDDSSGLVAVDA